MMGRFPRLVRYGLLTLFIFTLMLTLSLAAWGWLAERQRHALNRVQLMGGTYEEYELIDPMSQWRRFRRWCFYVPEAHLPRTVSEADFEEIRSMLPFTRVFRNRDLGWHKLVTVKLPASERRVIPSADLLRLRELGERYEKLEQDQRLALAGQREGTSELSDDSAGRRPSPLDQIAPEVVEFINTASAPAATISAAAFLFWKEIPYSAPPASAARAARRDALQLLQEQCLRDPDLHFVFAGYFTGYYDPAAESLLRVALSESPHRHVQKAAGFNLALLLLRKAKLPDIVKLLEGRVTASEQPLPHLNAVLEGYRTYASGVDPAAARREAETLLERVEKEYRGIRVHRARSQGPGGILIRRFEGPTRESSQQSDYADRAARILYRLRDLQAGQAAPEIVGEDPYAETFRLSDYRGDVVVLFFAANWCGPCKQQYPNVRALVEKYEGRPVTILGVSADDRPGTVRKAIEQGDITWRCWWDGRNGPIATNWDVPGWPTFHVIDQQGVFRASKVAPDRLESPVEKLLSSRLPPE